MIKNTLLFLLSFSLIFSLSIQKTKIAQAAFPEPQRICNFNPNGAVTGNVTLANDCVIYEDVNGAANGNIVLNGNHVTLYRTMVWYPGYEIQITNGATIYVNSNAQIVQRIICLKDADGDFIPGTKALTVNPETGTQVTTALTQLDATVSGIQGVCPQDYKARENFTTLAYADLNDVASPSDSAMQSTTDNELLRLGFTIDGVTDVYAATGDIQINKDKNLILLPDGLGGKLGIGTTAPTTSLHIEGTTPSMQIRSTTANDYAGLFISHTISGGQYEWFAGTLDTNAGKFTIGNQVTSSHNATTATSANAKMTIDNAGNVGIGTTTPTYTLMTNGSAANDITSAGSIYAYNSASTGNSGAIVNVGSNSSSGYIGAFNSTHTAAALADRFVMAANSNAAGLTMYAANAGQDIRFFTDAATSERMRINSNGNVGIGTIAPGVKLEVAGTGGTAIQISSGGDLVITAAVSGNNTTIYNDTGTLGINTPVSASTFIGALQGNASTATNVAWTGVTNRPSTGLVDMVDTAGNAMSQAWTLAWKNYGNHQIIDASAGTAPNNTVIDRVNSATAWSSTYPTLMGWNGISTYGVRVDSSRIADQVAGDIYVNGKLIIQNTTDGTNARGIFMWSASDPAWGIYMGTSGAGKSLSGGTAATGVSGFNLHAIRLRVANSASQGIIFENSSEQLLYSVRGDGAYTYLAGNVSIGVSTAQAEKLYITSGTTTDTVKAVNTSSGAALVGYNSSSGPGLYGWNSGTGWALYCNAVTANKCGGNQAWYNVSDRRTKENILPIHNALSTLLKLQGVTYNLKKDPKKSPQMGFIAQDVLPYVPEVVGFDDESGTYGMQTSQLTALIVNAIKEQQSQITSLTEKINKQNEQINALTQKIEEIENKIKAISSQ